MYSDEYLFLIDIEVRFGRPSIDVLTNYNGLLDRVNAPDPGRVYNLYADKVDSCSRLIARRDT